MTKLENGYVPDEVYAQVREHFDEQQLMKLTLAVVAINGWNRFNIAFNNARHLRGRQHEHGQDGCKAGMIPFH